MKTAKNVDGRPQKQVPSMKRAVFVDGNARSMRSEPFGVARAACFEQLLTYFRIDCLVNYRRYENPHYLAPTVPFYVSLMQFCLASGHKITDLSTDA